MKHIKYKDDSPVKEEEKIKWPEGKAGEKEKQAYLDVINHAVLLDGGDIFMLDVAVNLKL